MTGVSIENPVEMNGDLMIGLNDDSLYGFEFGDMENPPESILRSTLLNAKNELGDLLADELLITMGLAHG